MTEFQSGFDPTQPLSELDMMRANLAHQQMLATHLSRVAFEQEEIIDAQDEHISHLEEVSETDTLMGIANRRRLERTYQGLMRQHPLRRHDDEDIPIWEAPNVAIMIDVDHFSAFNNTYGHSIGDAVLREVAGAVSNSVRSGHDEPGRYGGEEIAVLLPRTSVKDAMGVAEKIRSNIETLRVGEQELQVTASLGVAELLHGTDLAEGVRNADVALYAAKEGGRNQVVQYNPTLPPKQ